MFESHLMQVDEAPELFADAVLVDAADNLLFLSLWGRDTALQEFLARLSLPSHEGGLDSFFYVRKTRGANCPGASSCRSAMPIDSTTTRAACRPISSVTWPTCGCSTDW